MPASCRITFASGDTVDVAGALQAVIDELHKVSTRREHTFAVLDEPGGASIAIRPDAVLHIRPLTSEGTAPPPG
jgi:hypothetical protein